MNSSVLLTSFIILGLVYTVTALKSDECEVCINIVERFVNTLSEDVKKIQKRSKQHLKTFVKVLNLRKTDFVII